MKFEPSWSSHYPLLVKVLNEAKRGSVLELGMGPFSTPLLHWLCFDKGMRLFSFDNDPKYFELNKKFEADHHLVTLVENWDEVHLDPGVQFTVAFVDHKPARRRHIDIKNLVNCQFVIVHDTEPDQDKWYAYRRIWKLFKYRYDYTKAVPHTTVLSNFNDLSFLMK